MDVVAYLHMPYSSMRCQHTIVLQRGGSGSKPPSKKTVQKFRRVSFQVIERHLVRSRVVSFLDGLFAGCKPIPEVVGLMGIDVMAR